MIAFGDGHITQNEGYVFDKGECPAQRVAGEPDPEASGKSDFVSLAVILPKQVQMLVRLFTIYHGLSLTHAYFISIL